MSKNISLLCNILMAIVGVLVWFKVEPRDVRMIAGTHWVWFAVGLTLFVFSVVSSLYSLRENISGTKNLKKQHGEELATLRNSHVDEIRRLSAQHQREESNNVQVKDIAIEENHTLKERIRALEHQLAETKKCFYCPPGELPVLLQPTNRPSSTQFLIVTNKGAVAESMHAQCKVLDPSGSGVIEAFDLGWEGGQGELSIGPEEFYKLYIARAWDDANHLRHITLCELMPQGWRDVLPQQRDIDDRPCAVYRVKITVFGRRENAVHAEQFIVREGTNCAIEMLSVSDAASERSSAESS